jgi:hypothetical protein
MARPRQNSVGAVLSEALDESTPAGGAPDPLNGMKEDYKYRPGGKIPVVRTDLK